MAVIKPGPTISKIAGASGSKVYSSWKGRGVIRSKAKSRSNPASSRQATARAGTASLAKAWDTQLTDEGRALWNQITENFTAAIDSASTREQGSRVVIPQPKPVLSGYDAFIRDNQRAIMTGIRDVGNPVLTPSTVSPSPPTELVEDEAPPISVNWALSFDGVNEDVDCQNVLSYDYTAAFAWEFWWWGKTPAQAGYMVSKMDNIIKDGYNIQWAPNVLYFQIRRATGGELLEVSRAHSGMLAWHHFVITYDGSNNANGIRVYINSVVGQAITSNIPITASIVNPADLTFASLNGFAGTFGLQNMDCIRNFNRNLIQADVDILWNGGAGLFGPNPLADGSNQGCWSFCTGSGVSLYDISGNNYTGLLRNMEAGDWIPGKVPCPDIPGAKQLEWSDPDDLPVGGKIRVWCLSYDAGVHKQHVATVDRGVEAWIPDVVRISKGAEVPIANMPGHYLFQLDAVSPDGTVSPPSNTIEAVCPLV